MRRRFAAATWFMIILAAAGEGVLLVRDRDAAYESLGLNAYLAILWFATARYVSPDDDEDDSGLVARGSRGRVGVRTAVVIFAVLFVTFPYAFVANGMTRIPVISELWTRVAEAHLPLGTTAVLNPVLYAILPIALLLALGARPRELGLSRWAPGTSRAALFVLILPVAALAWSLIAARHSVAGIAFMVSRNFLSSGFSEEVLFRGLTLSHLRAFWSTEWATTVQALLFGLFHLASSVGEPGFLTLAAYLFTTSAVPGFLLGLIALRTRSLGLPILIHTTLGVLKDVVR
jgi:membrane protease YdiL (CAAX protease family)